VLFAKRWDWTDAYLATAENNGMWLIKMTEIQ
jgi:hypothetical protein